jgi:hypothetical protein
MKIKNSLMLVLCMSTIFSCNSKSDHPQASLLEDGSSTSLNDKTILAFSDSLNRNLFSLKKTISLIYMLGDNSLYVERYTNSSGDKVYFEQLNNGTTNSTLNKYYFKNDSLMLISSFSKQVLETGPIFKDTRVYLRNNTAFKKENRTATSAAAIQTLPYLLVQDVDSHASEESYFEKIAILNDAIAQTNKFEMVFDNVTTYPDSRSLVLKSKIQNSYTASIIIETKSPYIDSLLSDPSIFRNEKLKFNWTVKDNEAIYVPERDSTTSASGLNK